MYLTKEVSEDIINFNSHKTSTVLSRNTFSKSERLHQDLIIASLFSAGQNFFIRPFKVYFLSVSNSNFITPVKILISVPKKHIKNATDRNKIKRQIREAIRKNKHPLYDMLLNKKKNIAIAIIFNSKKITTFNEIENKIKITLNRLTQEAEKNA